MIRCSLVCTEEHFWKMDTEAFCQRYASYVVKHEKYDRAYIIYVTLDDGIGDYCMLEDRILHLVLHVEPSIEAMIEAFERNFVEPER